MIEVPIKVWDINWAILAAIVIVIGESALELSGNLVGMVLISSLGLGLMYLVVYLGVAVFIVVFEELPKWWKKLWRYMRKSSE